MKTNPPKLPLKNSRPFQAPVMDCRSEPAKSTKVNLELRSIPPSPLRLGRDDDSLEDHPMTLKIDRYILSLGDVGFLLFF